MKIENENVSYKKKQYKSKEISNTENTMKKETTFLKQKSDALKCMKKKKHR